MTVITNRVTLPVEPDDVFALALDLDAVGQCIPGARVGSARDGTADGILSLRFGPMAFDYEGTVRITSISEESMTVSYVGSGAEQSGQGSAKISMDLAVEAVADGSQLTVVCHFEVSGPIAQIGRGMMEEAAQELMEGFKDCVLARFGHAPESPRTGTDSSTIVAGSESPSLGWRFAMRVVWRSIRRLTKQAARAGAGLSNRLVGRLNASSTAAESYDVIVVGSGSGALAAAISAHDDGLSVVIVEKADVVGGGTAYSGGVVWAPANHIMRRKRIDDSTEDALDYLAHAAGGRGDPEIARTYVENVGKVIEQVESWTGISWVIWPGQPDYYPDLPGARTNGRAILQHPNSAHEVLDPAEDRLPGLRLVRHTPHMDYVPGFQRDGKAARESWVAGRAIIGGLWKAALERDIPYHLSTEAVDLVTKQGRVVGIVVSGPTGRRTIVGRLGVLLNTGGFDWREDLARRYLPGPTTYPQTPPSNTGDGHVMAMSLGAGTALMDKAVLHPAIRIPGDLNDGEQLYRMFNAELCKPHSMVVNSTGRRFASEAAYFDLCDAWNDVDHRTRNYSNVPSYFIFDNNYAAKYGLPCVHPGDPVPEWIRVADSLDDLAVTIGVDAHGLNQEVDLYNSDCEEGVDSRFGRGSSAYERYWGDPEHDGPNPTMGPVESAPFFAIELFPSHAGTRGGVLTTPWGQVKRADGTPIAGLYACGNTAANLLFGAGYGSGSAVGSSLVFGYLSAKHMAI